MAMPRGVGVGDKGGGNCAGSVDPGDAAIEAEDVEKTRSTQPQLTDLERMHMQMEYADHFPEGATNATAFCARAERVQP